MHWPASMPTRVPGSVSGPPRVSRSDDGTTSHPTDVSSIAVERPTRLPQAWRGTDTFVVLTAAANLGLAPIPTAQAQVGVSPPSPDHPPLQNALGRTRLGTPIVRGTDPGDFYCEHLYFIASELARGRDASIVANRHGEPLVGFLHLPGRVGGETAGPALEEVREVVAYALRGYVLELASVRPDTTPRITLSGFMSWGDQRENPSHGFVRSLHELHATVRDAFSGATVVQTLRVTPQRLRVTYELPEASTGRLKTIELESVSLPVDDRAINGREGSIQHAMADFRPHGLIALGVHVGSTAFRFEHHADDGGLNQAHRRGPRHDPRAEATRSQPQNLALERAYLRGAADSHSTAATTPPGSPSSKQ